MDAAKLLVMLADKGKKKQPDEAIDEESEASDYSLMASEILTAIKADDADQLADALQSFVDVCVTGEHDED